MKITVFLLLCLFANGCTSEGGRPPIAHKQDARPDPKFKFHDKVLITVDFFGPCISTVKASPYWSDYCGKNGAAQWVYTFGLMTCDGEVRRDAFFVCEQDIGLIKRRSRK